MQEEMFKSSGNKLLDQKDVAEMLGVSTKTLEGWRCRKIGPNFIKLGRLARYRVSDVMAFIEALVNKEVIAESES